MGIAVATLNSIRNNADTDYQTRVPVATKSNIQTIGRVLDSYPLVYNTFMSALMHRIGLTTIESKSFKNKLAKFKSGAIMSQQDIEEIWVNEFRQAEGSYDANGGMETGGINPFKRRQYQDIQVKYHKMNRQDKYVVTISKVDVIRAFRSEGTLDAFITAQFNSLYTGDEYDEYVHMKQLLNEGIAANHFYSYLVDALDGTVDKARAFVRTCKKAIKDMSYVSTTFNPAGVKTKTDAKDLVMFVNKDVAVHMDVDLYAQIFGPDYAKLGIEVVELDNFGADDTGTYALICDKNWFKVYDNLIDMEELKNPEGLYTNYWLHHWQTLSYSKFKNAVRIGTAEVTSSGA